MSCYETIINFLNMHNEAHVLREVTAIANRDNRFDCTVVYLCKFSDQNVAQRIISKRAELLSLMGSFNVQLAYEDRKAMKNLKILKDTGIIAGFGQNRLGFIYVSLWKQDVRGPEKEFIRSFSLEFQFKN